MTRLSITGCGSICPQGVQIRRADGLLTHGWVRDDPVTPRTVGAMTRRAGDPLTRRADDLLMRRADDPLMRRADDPLTWRADDRLTRRADDPLTGRRVTHWPGCHSLSGGISVTRSNCVSLLRLCQLISTHISSRERSNWTKNESSTDNISHKFL